MGRRAKKAPVQTKKRPTLAKKFKCPFCANQETCECKLNFSNHTGRIECRLCGAAFQTKINHLTEPIDIFSEWLDECEAAQNQYAAPAVATGGGGRGAVASSSITQPQYQEDSDDDDDDDVGQASGLKGSSGGGGGATGSAKGPSSAAAGSSSKKSGGDAAAGRATYAGLGLDDSDDDSD